LLGCARNQTNIEDKKMTNESEVAYGSYSEAFKAIHSALSGITAPPTGHKITKWSVVLNEDGTLSSLTAKEGAVTLFAIAFTWIDSLHFTFERTDA
jgi:hypothetical protein